MLGGDGVFFTQTSVKIRTELPRKCAVMYRKFAEDWNIAFVINCVIPGYFTVGGSLKWTNAISIRGIRRRNPQLVQRGAPFSVVIVGNSGWLVYGGDKLCISLGFYNIQTDGGLRGWMLQTRWPLNASCVGSNTHCVKEFCKPLSSFAKNSLGKIEYRKNRGKLGSIYITWLGKYIMTLTCRIRREHVDLMVYLCFL